MGISIGSGIGGSGIGSSGIGGSGISGSSFSPLDLSPAAYYDNGDLSTLFSDAARTTQAVVDGEVLGQTDKSGNGLHRTGTAGTGPILRQRSDGVYYLDYAGGKTLNVPSSTSAFNGLHDGTGGSILALVEWPQGSTASNYIQNCASTTQVGFQVYKSAATEGLLYGVNRGVGGEFLFTLTVPRFSLSSDLNFFALRFKNDGAADDAIGQMNSGVTKYTGQAISGRSPSTADATLNLAVINTFGGHEYALVLVNRKLEDAEVDKMYRWARARYYQIPNVDYTFVLGGQSNMSGRGTVVSVEPEEKLIGAYSYTKAEEFRLTTVPEHSVVNRPVATSPDEGGETAPQHGFMLRAQKALKNDSSVDTLIVPCAIGSTSIGDWNTPLTIDDRTTLIGAMKYRYGIASQKGGTPVIVWYGHESDVGSAFAGVDYVNGGVGSTYQTDFAALIETVRNDVIGSEAPLIMVQLASDDTLSIAEAHAAAGEAQRQLELSIPNCHLVVTHDVQRNASPDDIHVSRDGMDTIADRVALAVREHILGEAVNGTGPRIVSASYSGSTITLNCDKVLNTTSGDYGNLFRVYDNGVEATVSSANRGTDTSTVEIVCSAPLSGPVTLTYGYRAGAASAARTDFVADADGLPLPVFGPYVVVAA